ncbi:MAG TPA: hypothetical protein VE093_14255 [Polyangiaceae bacterium]|jgi:hypothetical protein|nr:hypothetical protein [Polyangiaceae bacterium]
MHERKRIPISLVLSTVLISAAAVGTLTACGGGVVTDPGSTSGSGGDGGGGVAPGEEGYAAIALPKASEIFLIVGHAPDGRTCDSPDTKSHCGHWSVTVELPWEAVKIGSISLKSDEPFVNAHCIKIPDDGDGEPCPSTQISGVGGTLAIDAIDADAIHGRLNELTQSGLPSGEVDFRAVRCPGDWKVP